jgi:hypothetical protein
VAITACTDPRFAAANKLVDVRNKLAERIQQADELMVEGVSMRDLGMGVGAVTTVAEFP